MSFAAIVLASAITCQPPVSKAQIGLWESDATSKGGIGSNIEFRPDGTFVAAIVVLVDLKYEIRGDMLYTAKNRGEKISPDTGVRILVKNDSYTVSGKDGKPLVHRKMNPTATDTIAGKYKYRHYTGLVAYEHFTGNGMLHLRIPMSSSTGCYAVKDNVFDIIAEGKEPQSVLYELNKGKLTLIRDSKRSMFSFVKEGVWYQSDPIDYLQPVQPAADPNTPDQETGNR